MQLFNSLTHGHQTQSLKNKIYFFNTVMKISSVTKKMLLCTVKQLEWYMWDHLAALLDHIYMAGRAEMAIWRDLTLQKLWHKATGRGCWQVDRAVMHRSCLFLLANLWKLSSSDFGFLLTASLTRCPLAFDLSYSGLHGILILHRVLQLAQFLSATIFPEKDSIIKSFNIFFPN